MSQKDDSENDIWEYKPVGKKKKTQESLPTVTAVTRRKCAFKNTCMRNTVDTVKTPEKTVKVNQDGDTRSETHTPNPNSPSTDRQIGNAAEGLSSGDFCPMCQMPFSVLVVQTYRWHVAECLDTPRDKCKECPDGLQCSSTIPNHYKNFNHTLLAHSRANSDTALLGLSPQAGTSTSPLPGLQNKKSNGSDLETSQDSIITRTPPSKLTKGLLFLRSPGPDDFKKKKGWSRSSDAHKSTSASQESKPDLTSTPIKEESRGQACENSPKTDQFLESDDSISYSPLSEFPPETEVNEKITFNKNAFENEDEDSMELFSNDFSSEDELLTQFIDNMDTGNVSVKDLPSSSIQLETVTSLTPTNVPASAVAAENTADSTCRKDPHAKAGTSLCKSSIQSPQSIVLERLRETLITSESQLFKNLHDSIESEQPHTDSHQVPSSQTSALQRSKAMPPQKGQNKGGQASCLKQTDIGVFFGLKPLKEKEADLSGTSAAVFVENSGQIRQRRERRGRQRKNKTDTTTDTSQGAVAEDRSATVSGQGEGRGGWTRGWRRRNRADGEVQIRRCPFYKKIPGTKFAVDAFQYGEIEGVTGYFLTHFHSDHYTGLTKHSTFPIYCNKITGNLVKSKLKVAEQYVHILPMNTQVTVEGVRVTLLDANHCPGAAMLLFFLPDGQIVLHTGDFRADPSMETYPELLSCRVQTLYLDTTYCSSEYTFPRQQEVISFAASTAFELVTLNPRTLVVCGSYSVGKEKVFLALAEILGTKVCLSRDKYNTMCCLESEQVRQSITTDWKAAQVHVLPMMQLSFSKLQQHLGRFSDRYDQLVAFKPTGWTFSQQVQSVEDIQPQINGNISIYGIPYSEHSSFLELKRFVQWLQPLKIIPTVNNGSWATRKAMEKCFSEWLMETRAKL